MMNVLINGAQVGVCSDIQPDDRIGYMLLSERALVKAGVNWIDGLISRGKVPLTLIRDEDPQLCENRVVTAFRISYKDECILIENAQSKPYTEYE